VAHKWATELGQALVFLHRCKPPIIHRDVKPGIIYTSQRTLSIVREIILLQENTFYTRCKPPIIHCDV